MPYLTRCWVRRWGVGGGGRRGGGESAKCFPTLVPALKRYVLGCAFLGALAFLTDLTSQEYLSDVEGDKNGVMIGFFLKDGHVELGHVSLCIYT